MENFRKYSVGYRSLWKDHEGEELLKGQIRVTIRVTELHIGMEVLLNSLDHAGQIFPKAAFKIHKASWKFWQSLESSLYSVLRRTGWCMLGVPRFGSGGCSSSI